MTILYNTEKLKNFRKDLRINATEPEKILWKYLRGKRLCNIRFVRQYSVGNYIIDFYAPKLKLGIELDGEQHFEDNSIEYDDKRDTELAEFGITIIRFTNFEVYYSVDTVLETIERFMNDLKNKLKK